MENQKQEDSLKHSLMRSINLLVISGKVLTSCEFRMINTKYICAKCRLELDTQFGTKNYIDIIGLGDIAKQMNLACSKGNLVLVEAEVRNKRWINKKNEKKAKIWFEVKKIQVLAYAKPNVIDINEAITIIDELDPMTYLEEN